MFVEKPRQIALGIPLGAGITYLSWKYPGIIQKAMWDVLYGKVVAQLYKKMSMGTILLYMSEDEVDKLAREAFAVIVTGKQASEYYYGHDCEVEQ